MKKLIAAILGFILGAQLYVGAALAQATPPVGLSPTYSSFTLAGRLGDISVTTSSQTFLINHPAPLAIVYNTGAAYAYVEAFTTDIATSLSQGIPVPPGACAAINVAGQNYIAAIGAGSTTLQVTFGWGNAGACGGGAGGGGGGGSVTQGTVPWVTAGSVAVGSAGTTAPNIVGGTSDGSQSGNVSAWKVVSGVGFINCANCSGSGISVGFGASIGSVGTPNGYKDGSGNFQPILGDITNGQWVSLKASVTVPISAASLPLPTGAATATLQGTGNTSLGTIATNTANIPALGQALAAGSVPVVFTASQLSTLTPLSTVTVTQSTGSNLHVACDSGCSSSSSPSFGGSFPTTGTPIGMSQGSLLTALTGTGGSLNVDVTNSVTVSGTVTANAGTNLNTSLLALESGGNIANIYAAIGNGVSPAANTLQARLVTINTTLGTPFQTGGSIGNTSFGATQATASNLNATVVGTGTFAVQAAQSGTWNITNVSGTVSLPTGASTSALQTTGNTSLGTIVTNTANIPPLGQALAAASVPVVFTAAQLTTLTPLTSVTVTQATGTNLHVVCDSGCTGSGGGGTSSNFGSAFPTAGTAIGLTNGTNMVAWSATTNYGTAPAAIAVPAVNASVTNTVTVSGTVTANAGTNLNTSLLALESGGNLAGILTTLGLVSPTPVANTVQARLQTLNTTLGSPFQAGGSIGNTTFAATQATAANLNATVVGTGTFAVQAAQSGTWNIGSITTLPALVAGSAIIGKVGIDQTTPGTTNLVALAANQSVNQTQLNSVALGSPSNYGTSPGAVSVQGVNAFVTNTVAVSLTSTTITGTVAATQSGTWNIGTVTTLPALVAGSAIIGKVGIDQTTVGTTNGVALAQIGAVTVATGAGATSTGTQRVGVAQDTTTIAGSAPGTAGSPSANVLTVQGSLTGTVQPVAGSYFTNVTSSVLTRASNTTAYTGAQTVCLLVSTTVCAPITISIANTNAGKGFITKINLLKSGGTTTNASFIVWLFSAAPGTATPSQFDATAYSGPRAADMPNYIGSAQCTVPTTTSDTSAQVWFECTLSNPNIGGALEFQALSGATTIDALLSVAPSSPYVPVSAETFTVYASGFY